ncbi:50S ribosomal protein L19 [bacterium]|nr:50S ribosomal protein L19 [bacterium]
MLDQIIRMVEAPYLKKEPDKFGPGDTVKVHLKTNEGDKERVQIFQGIVISIRGRGVNRNFTVRKVSQGIGVEKTFPLHSPLVKQVEVVREGKVRRAKIYYIRGKVGKSARIKEKKKISK